MRSKEQNSDSSVDLAGLAEIVERFTRKKIVLFGDFVADQFLFGDISRVSREAPVLILRHRETRVLPGGGANAANNLAALSAAVLPITVVGADAEGDALTQHFQQRKIDTRGIFRANDWSTPTKTRFLAGWAHTVPQQVLRVDREPSRAPSEVLLRKLASLLQTKLRKADGLAISDYGFGVASPAIVKKTVAAMQRAIPVTLDARYQLEAYAASGITAATPNEAELETAHNATIGRNRGELERNSWATLKKMNLQSLLVTRGSHGLAVFDRNQRKATHIPVHGSDQAVDVTGAGDTVLAAYTLALACQATPLEAAHIANIAGGLVVMKRGTAVVTQNELLAAIRGEISGGTP